MKERITAIFLFFLALLTIWAVAKKHPATTDTYGTLPGSRSLEDAYDASSLRDEVIRLHILADSDSEEDQQIKLLIRDTLLPYLSAATLGAASKDEALQMLLAQCPDLTTIANQALRAAGVDYSADVTVTECYFPIRIYGSQTYLSSDAILFPPGTYSSVQIVLGRGEGHNWWCLAYPSLCFIDATYEYIPKESASYLEVFATLPKGAVNKLFYGTGSSASAYDTENEDILEEEEVRIYLDSKLKRLWKELFQKEKENF